MSALQTLLAVPVAALAFSAGVAWANAPTSSLRPEARANGEPATAQATRDVAAVFAPSIGTDRMPTPKRRPTGVVDDAQPEAVAAGRVGPYPRPMRRDGLFATHSVASDDFVEVTRQVTRVHFDAILRPTVRPPHPLDGFNVILASAVVPVPPEDPLPKARPAGFAKLFSRRGGGYSAKGSVCGVNAIKGTAQKSFGKPKSGCGIANPVKVTSISGVRLSQSALVDCTTAKALNDWVVKGLKPAIGDVTQIKVAAHYACRNRNNRSGGKLSEHAKGHAIDISGFVLRDGSQVTVQQGWRSKSQGGALKKVHRAACGPFGTVLGPNANRYHQDHFHFDTARYRSGTYCR